MTNREIKMRLNRGALAGLCALVALALATPTAAAPVLLTSPPTGTAFRLEFALGLERDSSTRAEAEAKVKYERKEPKPEFKAEAERKSKPAIGVLSATTPFRFTATPEAGGVRFGFDAIPELGLSAASIFVPTAELVPITLMELEFEVESPNKNTVASGMLGALAFNGTAFGEDILLTTPGGQDEVKLKQFFALPGGDAFTAPFTLAGTLTGLSGIDEMEVKIKLGSGTFIAPPRPPVQDPVAVSEPASAALLAAGLAGLIGSLRRRRQHTKP
jgi:hypothetical protein